MLLSKSCVYGLRAGLYLAPKDEHEFISIRQMSEDLNISFHFLTKILQHLTADGLMESYKGPTGGVKLTLKGKNATLYDIVISIDGPELFIECVLGLPGCGTQTSCPLHDTWLKNRDSIEQMLKKNSIQKLAKESKKYNFRLTDKGHYYWD